MRPHLIDAAVILPPLAALGAVSARACLTNAGIGHGGLAILAAAIVYLAVCVALRRRQGLLVRLALLGWSSLLTLSAGAAVLSVINRRATTAQRPAGRFDPDRAAAEEFRLAADAHKGQAWVRDYYREYHRARRSEWHSYVYWRRIPFAGKYITVDDRGIRRTWNASDSRANPTRIFMFGGSSMWGLGARDDHTIASAVSRELTRRGHRVHVTNFGEDGYVSTQSLISLILRLRSGDVPDVVVFYSGVNDVLAALEGRHAGVPYREFNRRREFARMTEQPYQPTELQIDDEELIRQVVDLYLGNVHVLVALADQFDFQAFCYWQPVAFVGKPLTTYEQQSMPGLGVPGEGGYRSRFFRDAYAHMETRPLPKHVRNISRTFEADASPYYLDFCHVSERGNAVVARAIAEDIARSLSRPASRRHRPRMSERAGPPAQADRAIPPR